MAKVLVGENQLALIDDLPEHSHKRSNIKDIRARDKVVAIPPNYILVQTPAQLQECVRAIETSSVISLDTETRQNQWWAKKAVSMNIYTPSNGRAYFVPNRMVHAVRNFTDDELQGAFEDVFADPNIGKVGHNFKHDLHFTRESWNMEIANFAHDTLIASTLLNENEAHDLESLCVKYCGAPRWKVSHAAAFELWPMKVATLYACRDAEMTYKLYEFQLHALQRPKLKKLYAMHYEMEMPVVRIAANMEKRGVGWDQEYYDNVMKPMIRDAAQEAADKVLAVTGLINLDSPSQVASAFYETLGLPRPEGGGDTVAVEALTNLMNNGHEIARDMLEYRKFSTIDKMFVSTLPTFVVNGRIHCTFSTIGADTGRMSCRTPNLMQLPKRIGPVVRRAIIPSPGHIFVAMDFGQIELRILAHLSNDPGLIAAFNAGVDIHTAVMCGMLGVSNEDYKANPDFPEFVAKRVLAKCVDPDTFVWGQNKIPKRIGAFSFSDTADTFQAVVDTVIGPSGLIPVVNTYNGGIKPALVVVSRRGIIVTSEPHQFLLADGTLKRAIELTTEDVLEELRVPLIKHCLPPTLKVKVWKTVPALDLLTTADWAYLAGLYSGDGTVSENAVSICHGAIHKKDSAGEPYSVWQMQIANIALALGFEPTLHAGTETQSGSVYFGSRTAVRFFESLGLVADNKRTLRVPQWVIDGGKEFVMQFLAGLIDTDGTVTKAAQASLTTKDPVFGGQVAVLAQVCGLDAYVEPCWNKTYAKMYYRIHFTVDSSFKLKPYLRYNSKRNNLREPRQTSNVSKPNRILSVLPIGECQLVDLQVESEDHLYITNGFITHNTVNFGVLYGMGPTRLAWKTGVTVDEARAFIKKYFATYPGIKRFLEAMKAMAFDKGYVETIMGRKRRLPNARSNDGMLSAMADRQAGNSPIQGSVADLAKKAMLVHDDLIHASEWPYELLLQIHDELIYEVPLEWLQHNQDSLKALKHTMEHIYPLRVPIVVSQELLSRWGNKTILEENQEDGD